MRQSQAPILARSASSEGGAAPRASSQEELARWAEPPLALQLDPVVDLDDDQFFELCQLNRDLRIERAATGELLIMSPAGGATSDRNAEIVGQLRNWARKNRSGRVFDSSGGFILPDGATRAPDAAWVERERLRQLGAKVRERFLPLCPTFVIELRSPSDVLAVVQEKMREYRDNGARLGWLIDPLTRRVHVYRPGAEVEVLEEPATVSGAPELAGFGLEMAEIWDPEW